MEKIKALVEVINGKMVAIASDDSEDRHGDSIKQEKWYLSKFKKNPVLLMSHQYHLPPIGIAKNIKVEGKKMTFEPVFHEITQQAKEVKQMFQDGIMRAFSVGFMENAKGFNELLEISAVSVPANANALVFSKSFTEEEESNVKEWIDKKSIIKKKKKIKKTVEKIVAKSVPEKTVSSNEIVFSALQDINIKLNDIGKDRQGSANIDASQLVVRGLEKLNNQLGYLGRINKKGKKL